MGHCLSSTPKTDQVVVVVVTVSAPQWYEELDDNEHIWYDSFGRRFDVPETLASSFEGRKRHVFVSDIDPQRRAKHDNLPKHTI